MWNLDLTLHHWLVWTFSSTGLNVKLRLNPWSLVRCGHFVALVRLSLGLRSGHQMLFFWCIRQRVYHPMVGNWTAWIWFGRLKEMYSGFHTKCGVYPASFCIKLCTFIWFTTLAKWFKIAFISLDSWLPTNISKLLSKGWKYEHNSVHCFAIDQSIHLI